MEEKTLFEQMVYDMEKDFSEYNELKTPILIEMNDKFNTLRQSILDRKKNMEDKKYFYSSGEMFLPDNILNSLPFEDGSTSGNPKFKTDDETAAIFKNIAIKIDKSDQAQDKFLETVLSQFETLVELDTQDTIDEQTFNECENNYVVLEKAFGEFSAFEDSIEELIIDAESKYSDLLFFQQDAHVFKKTVYNENTEENQYLPYSPISNKTIDGSLSFEEFEKEYPEILYYDYSVNQDVKRVYVKKSFQEDYLMAIYKQKGQRLESEHLLMLELELEDDEEGASIQSLLLDLLTFDTVDDEKHILLRLKNDVIFVQSNMHGYSEKIHGEQIYCPDSACNIIYDYSDENMKTLKNDKCVRHVDEIKINAL